LILADARNKMEVKAKLNNLNIAPRKVRLVADLIRGKETKKALVILRLTIKRASEPLLKLLQSAISNARHNFSLNENNLYIARITVDEGRKLKRWEPRARGSASEIQKKTSHITLILEEIEKIAEKAKKAGAGEAKRPATLGEFAEKKEEPLRPRFKPEAKAQKPAAGKGIQKIFRRKAFSK